ncbi:MAG: S-layer homology domain-containing protein, partial [Chloroflexia bacterium]
AENGANGIYKSTVPASGCPASWTLSSRPDNGWPTGTGSGTPVYQTGGDTLGRIDLAMAPSDPNYIYAQVQAILPGGGSQRGGLLGVWRTTDGGGTWQQRSNVSGLTGCDHDYNQNWYDQGMAVDPNNPETLFLDGVDIFRSTNGGTTFTDMTCGYAGGNQVHVDQHALAYLPGSSTTLMAGSDGGSYVTVNANGGTPSWSQLNDSLNTIEFYSGDITGNFASSSAPGVNAGAQDNGSAVYVWTAPATPGPAMWQLRKGGDGMFARIEPVLGQRWYQESQNGNLAVSTSGPLGGLSAATGGWTGDTLSFVFPYEIYKYDCPPTGCTHMIAGSNRVWETVQGAVPASSWYANSPNLTKVTLADRSFINQLSYSVALSTTAIVGTNDGNVQYGFGLGQGTANTATWVNVTGGNSVLPNRPVLDVATDPVNPLVGYAALGGFDQNTPSTTGHVYQVTCTANCAGFTWVNKSGNLPNIPIDSIIANPLYPQQVFAGSDWGVYYTDNVNVASPVWIKFNAGMPNAMIWDMAIDRGFTTLAAFTRGRGAYAWPLPAGPVGGPTPTPTNTPTNTPIGNTPTNTPTNTNTPVGNTPTNTPTNTPVGSTPTNTPEGGSPTATATPCSITFTDVLPTDYFYVPVTYLYCHGAISGYADNTFRPGNLTTRGQLSKIVVLAEGWAIYTPPTPTFRDVDTS